MNILATGVRSLGIGKRTKWNIYKLTGRNVLIDEIIQQGHNVEWRSIIPGEDLSGYDRVILFLETISDWGANHTPGFLYVLYNRPDSIIVYPNSHEKLDALQKQFAAKSKSKSFIFRSPGFFDNDKIWREEKYQHMLRSSVELLASEDWDFEVLFPALDVEGADLSGFPTEQVTVYDPSPIWYKPYDDIEWNFENKKKQWSLASLRSAAKWVSKKSFSWEVNIIGDKKLGMERISERECNQIFADSWGILVDEYKHVGCGYVRYKYVACAKFGCIPFGDVRDFELIGPTWKWCAENLRELEKLSRTKLIELAYHIKYEYLKTAWTDKQFSQFASELIGRR